VRPRAATAVAAIAILGFAGCASGPPPVYFWGSYEDLLYEMYSKPGSADPTLQIQQLT
jgi:hypothetical protein